MPSRCMTACDGWLMTAVIDQITGSPSRLSPTSSAARAAFVA